MIVWIDAQLSPALAPWLSEKFGVQAFSARHLGLVPAKDREIFYAAREAQAVVLTKDANVMRGSALEVSMATGTVRLTAAGPEGRVQGLFVTNQGANASAAAAGTPPQNRGNPPGP